MSLRSSADTDPYTPHPPPSRPSDARRSRFDAVLRARDRATGCGFSPELGTAAPCGIVLVYCDDATSRFDTIAVLTSKTQEALNLDDHKGVAPQDFDELELTMLQGMRTYLPGPFYHNVFLAPGPVLYSNPSWGLAQRAAVGQVMLMDATPLVGPLLDDRLARALAPVVELAHEHANEKRPNVVVVPFRKTGQPFEDAIRLLI